MNKKDVTVLCPNGRRVNVKCTSTTSLGQIIEEACLKQKFDPLNYNLKHLKRILDPSNTIQYSNVPNHAQLELVETVTRRQEANVVVNLVTEDGLRLISEFTSNSSLWNILMYHDGIEGNNFCLPSSSSNVEPFLVYTMRKIGGEELKSTTLKSLGLYGGKCMMRYHTQIKESIDQTHRTSSIVIVNSKKIEAATKLTSTNENTGKIEPSSSSLELTDSDTIEGQKNSIASERETEKESLSLEDAKQEKVEVQSPIISNTSQSESMEIDLPEVGKVDLLKKDKNGGCLDMDSLSDNQIQEIPSTNANKAYEEMEYKNTEELSLDKEIDSTQEPQAGFQEEISAPKVIPLSDHESILFSLDDAPAIRHTDEEDTFFDLTSEEIRSLHREQTKLIRELEEAPLRTSKMKELEKDGRLLLAMNRHPITQLRICFPNQLVIQANFKPRNTVREVMDFLRPLLIRKDLNFCLCTMFPRKKLDPEDNLVEVGCIPKARLYFESEEALSTYLSEETLSKKSSFEAALKSVIKSKVQKQSNDENRIDSSGPKTNNSEKIKSTQKPKWFKLGK